MEMIKALAIESLGVVGSLFKPNAGESGDDALNSKKKAITYGNKLSGKKKFVICKEKTKNCQKKYLKLHAGMLYLPFLLSRDCRICCLVPRIRLCC